jgi:hypothetical protein
MGPGGQLERRRSRSRPSIFRLFRRYRQLLLASLRVRGREVGFLGRRRGGGHEAKQGETRKVGSGGILDGLRGPLTGP